jgi:hypothetical protein
VKFFPLQIRKYSGQPNDSLDLLEFITFPNAAEKIIQTNVVGLHKRNCPLIFIYGMEENMPSTYHQLALRFQENDS